jgi:hypothetical protein
VQRCAGQVLDGKLGALLCSEDEFRSGFMMRKWLRYTGYAAVCSAVSGVLTLETVPCYARSRSVSANFPVISRQSFVVVGLA